MNKARRAEIDDIRVNLENLVARIESVEDEEREYFDNMPEGLQQGEKGTRAEEVADLLSEARNDLENVLSQLEDAAS